MSKRVFRYAVVLVILLAGSSGVGVYFLLAGAAPAKKKPPVRKVVRATTPSPVSSQGKEEPRPSPVTNPRQPEKDGKTASVPEPVKPRTPQEVVEEAFRLYFGTEVRLTRISIEKGTLTLVGIITKQRQIQDAREVAVNALEEAGFGPFPEDKVVNLLRKGSRE